MSKSRDKIIFALAKLMKEKSYREISVSEICDEAEINRSTFYRNFSDVFDLVEKLPDEIIRLLDDYGIDCIGINTHRQKSKFVIFAAKAISLKEAVLIFSGRNGNCHFLFELIEKVSKTGRRLFDPNGNDEFDFLNIYSYTAFIFFLFKLANGEMSGTDGRFLGTVIDYTTKYFKNNGIELM